MGVSAGQYICEQVGGNAGRHRRRDRRHRLAAADPGPQPGLRGRAGGVRPRGGQPRSRPTSPSRAARRPRPTCCRRRRRSTPCGTTTTTRASASWRRSRTPVATSSSWSAAPARRTPCATSRTADGVLKATVIYPSTQGADGVKLARLLAPGEGDERPGRGRGAAHRPALRARRDRGERRPSTSTPPSSPDSLPAAPGPASTGGRCGPTRSPRPAPRKEVHEQRSRTPEPDRDAARDALGRHGGLRLHGRRPLAGLAQRPSVLRPPAPPADDRAGRPGRRPR